MICVPGSFSQSLVSSACLGGSYWPASCFYKWRVTAPLLSSPCIKLGAFPIPCDLEPMFWCVDTTSNWLTIKAGHQSGFKDSTARSEVPDAFPKLIPKAQQWFLPLSRQSFILQPPLYKNVHGGALKLFHKMRMADEPAADFGKFP